MKKYKILSIFVLAISMFILCGSSVNAKPQAPAKCKGEIDNDCYQNTIFGMNYDFDEKTKYVTIYIGKDVADKNGNSVVFRVISVNDESVKDKKGNYYTVSYKGNDKGTTIPVKLEKDSNVIHLITTTDVIVKSEKKGVKEKTKEIEMFVTIKKSMSYDPIYTYASYDTTIASLSVSQSDIDCSYMNSHLNESFYNNSNIKSFKDKFCYTKLKAINAGNNFDLGEKDKFADDKIFDNKCSVDAKKITSTNYGTEEYDDQYYQNRKYYYAHSEFTYSNLGQYRYNYYPGENYPGKTLSCKLKCQEAVSVEYGPPVATKAGLCFEYKVKVTSRVHCYVSQPPDEVEIHTKECAPGPNCWSSSGSYFRQGGPKQDFDKCVKECDGGKYSRKCSNTCYEKVYGKKLKVSSAQKTSVSSAVKECARTVGDSGCYYRTSTTGSITWYGLSGFDYYQAGRWYRYYPYSWGLPGYSYYIPINDGIYRAHEGSGWCQDYCYWGQCDWDAYLNPGQSEKDFQANKHIYDEALNTCQAKAKCSTTTTEYQISTQYYRLKNEKGDIEKITVHFPYSESSDVKKGGSLTDNAAHPDTLNTCDKENRGTPGKSNTTILDYEWCYAASCPSDQIAYLTEWSFPGSWVNKKTGEITYNADYDGKTGWRSKPSKFCVPRDALSVNALWYQWYFHKVEGTTTETYDNMCFTSTALSVIEKEKYSQYKNTPDEWNIFAKTRDFGYYKWNFDIKCFYALDNGDGICANGECAVNPKKADSCTSYRTRTVTTAELFPLPTGTTNSEGSSQERTAGYNWTNDASLKNQTQLDDTYKTDPSVIKEYIEKEGNNIYSNNSYIDYQFKLTPTDLKKIKDYNSHLNSFDTYCGKTKQSDDRISIYESNLFRSGVTKDSEMGVCDHVANGVLVGEPTLKLGTTGKNYERSRGVS